MLERYGATVELYCNIQICLYDKAGIFSVLCSLDLCCATPILVLQQGIMMSYLVFPCCLSGPGHLATEVAGMRDASDVVSLDVSPHIPR